ncbi:cyclic 2,3-diphosphoglycerate synthase [Tindallia californiensis]|uniref:Predicted GTPase n=1 Tax=Tindallia californiensis TaxID=159292 RepID=A0A1H3KDK8_9FIRM|nr:cyclic 2,3-diphosphoglycerate synthase [Tindallia californiensis]SDY50241.1 Predicted GTPase [Tindallia californiensis]
MKEKKVIIIGAAGRDFHNFNTVFRENDLYRVVAFTAAQIPDIDDRKYPAELAGERYPHGIPIFPQERLRELICDLEVDECIFAYSDVNYQFVMGIGAQVNAAGADFRLMGPKSTTLKSNKPVISVCATRTGCGKSQTARKIIENLMEMDLKVIVVRHPMPYGNLVEQKVQRFSTVEDLHRHHCTIEEMEEYEPHVVRGNVIYAGVDYEAILREAEKDPGGCDVIVWDGGNNDFSFYQPDLAVTVLDPHRPGQELSYYPGEVNLRTADVTIINKIDSADPDAVLQVENHIKQANPTAMIIKSESAIHVDRPELIKDKRVVVVEDGPTLTHGEMKLGAGIIAAQRLGASEIIDPRPYLTGRLIDTFKEYPDIGALIPAMGYGDQQLKDLEATINKIDCDAVVIGTPIDLSRVINIQKPFVRVHYELKEQGEIKLETVLTSFVKQYVK